MSIPIDRVGVAQLRIFDVTRLKGGRYSRVKGHPYSSLLFSLLSVTCTTTEYIRILVEMKQGQCICPLSWSVNCNFTGEGKCNERGWACTPHPHQPGLILPSSLNVRHKAAVATLCTLCAQHTESYSALHICPPPHPSLRVAEVSVPEFSQLKT
jgi:hypothetical protein